MGRKQLASSGPLKKSNVAHPPVKTEPVEDRVDRPTTRGTPKDSKGALTLKQSKTSKKKLKREHVVPRRTLTDAEKIKTKRRAKKGVVALRCVYTADDQNRSAGRFADKNLHRRNALSCRR